MKENLKQCRRCRAREEKFSIIYGTIDKNQKYGSTITCNSCKATVETEYIYDTPEDAVHAAIHKWNASNGFYEVTKEFVDKKWSEYVTCLNKCNSLVKEYGDDAVNNEAYQIFKTKRDLLKEFLYACGLDF